MDVGYAIILGDAEDVSSFDSMIQSSGFLLSAIQSHYCALPHATKLLTLSCSKIVTIHTSLHD